MCKNVIGIINEWGPPDFLIIRVHENVNTDYHKHVIIPPEASNHEKWRSSPSHTSVWCENILKLAPSQRRF